VFPVAVTVVELDDHGNEGRGLPTGVGGRPQVPAYTRIAVAQSAALAGIEGCTDSAFVDYGGLVPGPEAGNIDRVLIGAHRQGSRRVRKEAHDLQGSAAESCAKIGGIEYPHVGAWYSSSG